MNLRLDKELRLLFLWLVLGFALIALSTAYWSLLEGENLAGREDNPRRVLAEINIQRGRIFDRHGELLAYSRPSGNRAAGPLRIYPHPEAVSAVGHYSYRYGRAGVEAAYDAFLRGEGQRGPWGEFLNQNAQGGDLRLTLDLSHQEALAAAMQGQRGAAILLAMPSGEVLALHSTPNYDPNQITLLGPQQADHPSDGRFLNRVTQGNYQLGGVIQSLLVAQILANGGDLSQNLANTPWELNGLRLDCLSPPPSPMINLAEAYRRACPGPIAQALGPWPGLEGQFLALGFDRSPQLMGFEIPARARPWRFGQSGPEFELAGQGGVTASPLHILPLLTALLNEGQAVQPGLVTAQRPAGAQNWQALPPSAAGPVVFSPEIAAQLREVIEQSPHAPGLYGHLSRAYSGRGDLLWFLAWGEGPGGDLLALVLVLEGGEAGQAIEMARQALLLP